MQRIQADEDDTPLVCDHFEVMAGTGIGAYVFL